ncbi:hypothetical protein HDV00_001510 [Rhizophlyctis rosea]|nr:hypothetical protein HDV00_001510 [Rhizophlyctis rosea]
MLGDQTKKSGPTYFGKGRREPSAASTVTLADTDGTRSSRASSTRPGSITENDLQQMFGGVEPQIAGMSGTMSYGRGNKMIRAVARKLSRNSDGRKFKHPTVTEGVVGVGLSSNLWLPAPDLPPTAPNHLPRPSSPADKKFSSTPELPQEDNTSRRRPFSFFSNRSSLPDLSSRSNTEETIRRLEIIKHACLLRLLNYLHDLYDLDPRLNGPNVHIINAEDGDDAAEEELSGLTDKERAARLARLQKKQTPEKRRQVTTEILTTERTYVEQLQALVEVYIDPIEEQDILSAQDLNLIFSNIRNILMVHKE